MINSEASLAHGRADKLKTQGLRWGLRAGVCRASGEIKPSFSPSALPYIQQGFYLLPGINSSLHCGALLPHADHQTSGPDFSLSLKVLSSPLSPDQTTDSSRSACTPTEPTSWRGIGRSARWMSPDKTSGCLYRARGYCREHVSLPRGPRGA